MLQFQRLGVQDEDLEEIRRKPALHVLCTGAMLFDKMVISDDIVCIPCMPIGNESRAAVLATYCRDVLEIPFGQPQFDHAFAAGLLTDPLCVLVIGHSHQGPAEEIRAHLSQDLDLALDVVSSIQGRPLFPFFELFVAADSRSEFRMVPPVEHRSQTRTGIFTFEQANDDLAQRLFSASKQEERLAFVLGLLHGLIREHNPTFRIARTFNALEAIAWEQKNEPVAQSHWRSMWQWLCGMVGHGRPQQKKQVGSRTAIRRFLKMEGKNALYTVRHNGVDYAFDPIEFAGLLRDKLYHGARFRRNKLPKRVRPGYDLMQENPHMIADRLLDYAKAGLYSWIDEILEDRDASA